MMLLCNDGWHEMMLFICSGSTYLALWHKVSGIFLSSTFCLLQHRGTEQRRIRGRCSKSQSNLKYGDAITNHY